MERNNRGPYWGISEGNNKEPQSGQLVMWFIFKMGNSQTYKMDKPLTASQPDRGTIKYVDFNL